MVPATSVIEAGFGTGAGPGRERNACSKGVSTVFTHRLGGRQRGNKLTGPMVIEIAIAVLDCPNRRRIRPIDRIRPVERRNGDLNLCIARKATAAGDEAKRSSPKPAYEGENGIIPLCESRPPGTRAGKGYSVAQRRL